MAYPWIYYDNFETPFATAWDIAEADTGSLLDRVHYSTLAKTGSIGPAAPFRGAHCMRVVMGDTNVHTVGEGAIDVGEDVTRYVRFMLYISPDVAATADDIFNIFEFQQTDNTPEGSVSLRITAATNAVEIGIGDGIVASAYGTPDLSKGVWHSIELQYLSDANGSGTFELFVDNASYVALTGLTQVVTTHGVLGTQDTEATTTGTLLFDEFVFDDARIFPINKRYPNPIVIQTDPTLSAGTHAFVGPGVIENLTLMDDTGGDSIITVYDTDNGNIEDEMNFVLRLTDTAAGETVDPAGMPVTVSRGAFVHMVGTSPRALVKIGFAPGYGSEGAIRSFGNRRKIAPMDK